MVYDREQIGDVTVLKPLERLDVNAGPVLEQAVDELFGRAGRKVLIDLSEVSYVSSIGLSACLRSAQLAQTRGCMLLLSGLRQAVREVFAIAGLERVIDIAPTREHALSSMGWLEPRPLSELAPLATTLTLPEEILLLTLRDEGGRFVDLPDYALDFALAAAVLIDLCMRQRIDSDLQRITVASAAAVGDDVLDPALAALAGSRGGWSAEHWIKTLAREGPGISRRVVDRLVARGILRRKDNLLHWVLGGRRYPVLQDAEQREVKTRVLGILASGDVPSPRDVVIIALADACAVFDEILDLDQMMELRPRIAEVARMDLLAQALTHALGDMQSWGEWEGAPLGVYGSTADVAD